MAETSNNKRIAKNTILLYFRMILTMIISLYTSRIVLKNLGVEDFGIYNVVGGIVVMFSFLNSSMVNATQRYLAYELGTKKGSRLRDVFSTAVIIHAIIALCILLLSEIIGLWLLNHKMVIPENRINAAFWMFQFSIFSFILTVLNVPYNATIVAHERMSFFAYMSIMEVSMKLLIVYLLSYVNFDKLIFYGFLIFCVGFVVIVIYHIYCRKYFEEVRLNPKWNTDLAREMMIYAGWNLFSNLSCSVTSQGINILLNVFFGPAINAARGIAYQVQAAIVGFSANFMTAVNPQLIKSYADGNKEYTMRLMFYSSKYSFFLLYMISLPILIEIQYILELWLVEVPNYTSIFVQMILISALIDSITSPLQTVIQATGKIRLFQFGLGVIFLLTLPLSYFLLSSGFDVIYVFIVGIFSSAIGMWWRIIILKKHFRFSIFKYFVFVCVPIIMVVFISYVMMLLWMNILNKENFATFLLTTCLSVIVVVITCFIFGFNTNERKIVREKIQYSLARIR